MRLLCVLCAFLLTVAIACAGEPGKYIYQGGTTDSGPVAVRTSSQEFEYFWYMSGGRYVAAAFHSPNHLAILLSDSSGESGDTEFYFDGKTKEVTFLDPANGERVVYLSPGSSGYEMATSIWRHAGFLSN